MRLVLFDIDGTLITGMSAEGRFYRYLWRCGAQAAPQVLGTVAEVISGLALHTRYVFKRNKGYLSGLSVSDVDRLAQDWATEELPAHLHQPAMGRLRKHQAAGDHVVLLSGTPEFLANAIGARIQVAAAIGSSIATRNGAYRLLGLRRHPFGDTKLHIARCLAAQLQLGAENVTTYADSVHDLPLLSWAGQAVAVQPDRRLAAVAQKNGWPILDSSASGTLHAL